MKLKKIKEIPYRTGKTADKKYEYSAVAFTEDIDSEPHLFIEIFKNKKASLKFPVVRMIFTKNDWRLYDTRNNKWSKAGVEGKMEKVLGYNCWYDKIYLNTYLKNKDVVWKFFDHSDHEYVNQSWVFPLRQHISEWRDQRNEKKRAKRRECLKTRQQNTPKLPPDLDEWVENCLFKNKHFLYYKRHGGYADICCSKCGTVSTIRTRRSESFESQFQKIMEIPREGQTGICPACKCAGEYKAQGKVKSIYRQSVSFYVMQPYMENGVVIRYIQADKKYSIQISCQGDKETMVEAGEKTIMIEIARTYMEPGKNAQTDYHKYSDCVGAFWDDCNLQGYSVIKIKEGAVYPPSYEWIKGTYLRYSGAKEFGSYKKKYNLDGYMRQYLQWPQLEMFSKMGLYGVVEKIVDCHVGEVIQNADAKRPEDFLGIRRERMKDLAAVKGDTDYLKVWKMEKAYNQNWTWQQCILLHGSDIEYADIELVLKYTTMKKFVNKIENYSGVRVPETPLEYSRLCGQARTCLWDTVRIYLDYLSLRIQREYDLKNEIYLYPRDLNAAHDKMVLEANEEKLDKRKREVAAKYQDIQKRYRKLRKKYFYEDETYVIRPARSAEEIVEEGRLLHHCVGGDNYLQKHNSGVSVILLLRFKDAPEIPYITVEIQGSKILQWYGLKDKKPDAVNVQRWLNNYQKELKAQETSVGIA